MLIKTDLNSPPSGPSFFFTLYFGESSALESSFYWIDNFVSQILFICFFMQNYNVFDEFCVANFFKLSGWQSEGQWRWKAFFFSWQAECVWMMWNIQEILFWTKYFLFETLEYWIYHRLYLISLDNMGGWSWSIDSYKY